MTRSGKPQSRNAVLRRIRLRVLRWLQKGAGDGSKLRGEAYRIYALLISPTSCANCVRSFPGMPRPKTTVVETTARHGGHGKSYLYRGVLSGAAHNRAADLRPLTSFIGPYFLVLTFYLAISSVIKLRCQWL
jgi:hypothetical protein